MKLQVRLTLFLCVAILLAACGGEEATETPTPLPQTPTQSTLSAPDRCSEENLPAEVAILNKLMREFDDYSALASNTPQAQLVVIIPELQRVLRNAEELEVPPCLQNLQKYQVEHMIIVVQTLMAFMSNADAGLVNTGIMKARELRMQYDVEVARLLGITLAVAPSPAVTPGATPEAGATSPPPAGTSTAMVTNPGPNGVYIRTLPDFSAPQAGVLAVQTSTRALGRTRDNQWIQVEVPDLPGQIAWVYASLVELSIPIEQLPVVSP